MPIPRVNRAPCQGQFQGAPLGWAKKHRPGIRGDVPPPSTFLFRASVRFRLSDAAQTAFLCRLFRLEAPLAVPFEVAPTGASERRGLRRGCGAGGGNKHSVARYRKPRLCVRPGVLGFLIDRFAVNQKP